MKVLEEFEHKRLILDGIMWSFTQYVRILKYVKEFNNKGIRVNQKHLKNLLSKIYNKNEEAGNDSTVWLESIDAAIDQWANSITGNYT